jgi:hypothetical protein
MTGGTAPYVSTKKHRLGVIAAILVFLVYGIVMFGALRLEQKLGVPTSYYVGLGSPVWSEWAAFFWFLVLPFALAHVAYRCGIRPQR